MGDVVLFPGAVRIERKEFSLSDRLPKAEKNQEPTLFKGPEDFREENGFVEFKD